MTAARRCLLIASLIALAGCATQTPRSHADAVTQAACRKRAEQVYALQNPDAPYVQDSYVTSTRDAPFATSGSYGVTTQGLSNRYALGKLVDGCIASTGAGAVAPAPAPVPTQTLTN